MLRRALFILFLFTSSFISNAQQSYTDKLFVSKDMLTSVLNPAGDIVASIHTKEENQIIKLRPVNNIDKVQPVDIGEWIKGEFNITRLVWIDNKHIAAQISEIRNGIADLTDTKTIQRLFIIRIPQNLNEALRVFTVRTKGWLVSPLPSQENIFLYAKSGSYSKVYRVDVNKLTEHGKKLSKLQRIDGGQFKKSNELAKIKGFATRWFLDAEGVITSVLHYKDRKEINLSAITKDNENSLISSWQQDEETEIFKGEFDKAFFPMAIGQSNSEYYCLDLEEEKKRSVYKVNFDKKTYELAYKSDGYKVLNIELNEQRSEILAVRMINDGKIEYDYLTQENSETNNSIEKSNNYRVVINKSEDGKTSIVYTESYAEPGQFYVTRQGQAQQKLGSHYQGINGKNNSLQHMASVTVNDVDVPYILNTPSLGKKHYPLIVMPHGGPIGINDTIYFDETTQYLIANGFAVLRVNFRGSSGYSPAYEELGKKAFTNLMLKDIYAATKDVLNKNKALDASRVCAYGASYGGYAALMLGIDYPSQFKCVVSWAGVTDIGLYLTSTNLSKKQIGWVTEYIAHAEKEYQQITERSPAYNIDKLTVPAFIAHGTKDNVVDIEHAYRIKLMLENSENFFEWYEDEESGHNFNSMDKQKLFYEKLVTFINKHI